jgi:hypothetical protein
MLLINYENRVVKDYELKPLRWRRRMEWWSAEEKARYERDKNVLL